MHFWKRTDSGFFESQYRKNADPWDFAGSDYEQGRFESIVQALSLRRYARTMEPGCSIGTLTERLAGLADHVDAFDFSATAVQAATQRCSALPNVNVRQDALKDTTTVAGYDLVVLSEVGYYFQPLTWQGMVSRFAHQLEPGATLLASHWLGESRDHHQSGDGVHDILRAEPLLHLEHEERHPGYRLDRFVRR